MKSKKKKFNKKKKKKKGKIVFWGKIIQPVTEEEMLETVAEPMIVPGLENETIIAAAVGHKSALFATDKGKLFYLHTKNEKIKE